MSFKKRFRSKNLQRNPDSKEVYNKIRAETRQCGAPPEIIFRGLLKFFSWMVIQKSEPRRGDAKLGGSGGMPPQKILRNLTLVWRLFGRFEPLRYLSFSKIYSLFYSDLIQSVGYRLRKTLIAFFWL